MSDEYDDNDDDDVDGDDDEYDGDDDVDGRGQLRDECSEVPSHTGGRFRNNLNPTSLTTALPPTHNFTLCTTQIHTFAHSYKHCNKLLLFETLKQRLNRL